MKVSLWLCPGGRHTLRFDETDADEIARLMQAVPYRLKVQVNDHRRNILGTCQPASCAMRRLNLLPS